MIRKLAAALLLGFSSMVTFIGCGEEAKTGDAGKPADTKPADAGKGTEAPK
jgi:hypothetical protein